MNVKKAVIPVAGLGTRMLPATKSIPKEMLPVFDKPLIQYIFEEAIAAGIQEIILVSREGKSAINNHFNQDFELEALLKRKGKSSLLASLQQKILSKISIVSVKQHEAKGLGDAILCAKPVIGNDPFAVLLPDVLIDECLCAPSQDNLAAMIKNFNKTARSQIMIERVSMDVIEQYGVVDCMGQQLSSGRSGLISTIVEKPKREHAPSNMCIVGRYVFDTAIWPCLENVKPDLTGEIQLTDAIADLMRKKMVEAYCIVGKSHDCGNKFGYAKANLEYALRDLKVGLLLSKHIQDNVIIKNNYNYAVAANS